MILNWLAGWDEDVVGGVCSLLRLAAAHTGGRTAPRSTKGVPNPVTPTAPYWLSRPCPTWCSTVHHADAPLDDAHHQSPTRVTVDATTAPPMYTAGGDATRTVPQCAEATLEQHHLHRHPHITLTLSGTEHDDGERELRLTPDEARQLAAGLLALADEARTGDALEPPLGAL